MSIEIRPAEAGDIEPVADLLYDNMSRKIPRERWRRILDYPWRPADAGCGMVATDGGRIVGFLGLIYADRVIGGTTRRFCNICAWYLLKSHRGHGIGHRIQRASVADPAMTYTIMTATAATGRAFATHSGFVVLDAARVLLHRADGGGHAIDVSENIAPDEPALSREERRIFADHRPFNLRHLLVRAGGETGYVVLQVKRKGDDIDYHEVLYPGAPGFLARHAPALAAALLPDDRSVLAIDRRFVAGATAWEGEAIPLPRWVRSPDVPPAAIDHLYGEVALLDLKL